MRRANRHGHVTNLSYATTCAAVLLRVATAGVPACLSACRDDSAASPAEGAKDAEGAEPEMSAQPAESDGSNPSSPQGIAGAPDPTQPESGSEDSAPTESDDPETTDAASADGRAGSMAGDPAPDAGRGPGTDDPATTDSGPGAEGSPTTACQACAGYGAPTQLGAVASPMLAELSGMTASWRNRGVLFAVNDRARSTVYALDPQGAVLAQFTPENAEVVDVEDIGIGPCASGAGTCLFLADFGDNFSGREAVAILAVPEPEIVDGEVAPSDLQAERYLYAYEDGPHNAEGLLVDPRSGALFIVTKETPGSPSSVYALDHPASTTELNTASKVVNLPIPTPQNDSASAATAHPCAAAFAVRTYDAIYEFRAPDSGTLMDAFSATPIALQAPGERQSEAITYSADGQHLLTSGEGESAGIFELSCEGQ